jgi:hypothetical protein
MFRKHSRDNNANEQTDKAYRPMDIKPAICILSFKEPHGNKTQTETKKRGRDQCQQSPLKIAFLQFHIFLKITIHISNLNKVNNQKSATDNITTSST